MNTAEAGGRHSKDETRRARQGWNVEAHSACSLATWLDWGVIGDMSPEPRGQEGRQESMGLGGLIGYGSKKMRSWGSPGFWLRGKGLSYFKVVPESVMLEWLHLIRLGFLYPAMKYNLQNSIVPAPAFSQSDAAADLGWCPAHPPPSSPCCRWLADSTILADIFLSVSLPVSIL